MMLILFIWLYHLTLALVVLILGLRAESQRMREFWLGVEIFVLLCVLVILLSILEQGVLPR